MKKIIKLSMSLVVLLSLLIGCKEEYMHEPGVLDGSVPSVISDVEVTPLNGGVKITYRIPEDKDVLYVKAVYTNAKGEIKNVKSSMYKNELIILGLNSVTEQTVKLYAYDRSENASKPYQISFTPLTSPVKVIGKSMEITEDFGGARYYWKNENQAPISILLFSKNKRGEMELAETIYTSQSEQKFSIRGYDTIPTIFAAVVRDRYDNFSDTIYAKTADKKVTPLWEEKLDKKKFKKIILSNDTNWDAWEGDYTNFYDDNTEEPSIIHSNSSVFPQIFSIDLGQVVKLSRMKVYQRQTDGFAYTHGAPKKFTIYGAKELPADGSLEEGSGWIELRDCEIIKPSGLGMGKRTDEDMDAFRAGHEFSFDNAPPLRYFRISFTENWDGASYIGAAEMTLWGTVLETVEED